MTSHAIPVVESSERSGAAASAAASTQPQPASASGTLTSSSSPAAAAAVATTVSQGGLPSTLIAEGRRGSETKGGYGRGDDKEEQCCRICLGVGDEQVRRGALRALVASSCLSACGFN